MSHGYSSAGGTAGLDLFGAEYWGWIRNVTQGRPRLAWRIRQGFTGSEPGGFIPLATG